MKAKEIVEKINNSSFYSLQTALNEADLSRKNCVKLNYNFSRHKNFDIVTNIYECEEGFVAITGLTNDRAKIGYKAYGIVAFAEEYMAVPSVMYVPKYRYKR